MHYDPYAPISPGKTLDPIKKPIDGVRFCRAPRAAAPEAGPAGPLEHAMDKIRHCHPSPAMTIIGHRQRYRLD
ncbi:MAG: hypothetical protein ACREXT_03820, partial [Gammaproteobacteria bacterium]